MTELIITVSVTVALAVAVACSLFGRRREPELDEDIDAPSIAVIDDALRQVGDNRDAQDWLLERRLAAMRREGASWPSI